MPRVDLNSDLGEGDVARPVPDDDALLDLVSSANVACGAHAGTAEIMRHICTVAAARGVAVGAHVSYRDREFFGRRFIDVDPVDLADAVLEQVATLDTIARSVGTSVSYVKPHGALYNAIVHHEVQARSVIDGVLAAGGDLAVMGLPDSAVLQLADAAGLRTITEAFADRGYLPDGTLVPRGDAGAVLHDAAEVAARVVRMVVDHTVVAVDGSVVSVDIDSVCVHGDSPGAVQMARAVRAALGAADVAIRPR